MSKIKYIIQSSLKAQGLRSSCLSITRAFNQDFRLPPTFHVVAGEPVPGGGGETVSQQDF